VRVAGRRRERVRWRTPWTALLLTLAPLLVACGPATDAGPRGRIATARVVELSIEGMRFSPDHIEVQQHETVRLVIRNPDGIPHEVFIGIETDQLDHRAAHASTPPRLQAEVPHHGRGAHIHALGTGQFDYRFDRQGELLIGCHLPGHWESGMRATILVRSSPGAGS
jgi:uncharacterized cupredoxin-like copper-binding protein